jgi:hypothetical protein
MTNTKPSKTELKTLRLRLEALRAELVHPFTLKCGAAAVKCVQETIDTVEAELARRLAA